MIPSLLSRHRISDPQDTSIERTFDGEFQIVFSADRPARLMMFSRVVVVLCIRTAGLCYSQPAPEGLRVT
jgi:hypothetical protein